ncbi:uncharacterized protein At4g04775-like [Chenopodium quinoa]|uniref:uncharacterized protein At4g04775-like n=1 Tax=Chenopodium quinoa TaxID=63459 RepID=UPI000B7932B6|nr:uncharacterized protein At4g04775-like [Chenopodium quinoa]
MLQWTSSSSYHSSMQYHPNKCNCGISPKLETSWTTKNPGRRFLACKFYDAASGRRGCKFFKWFDEDILEWQRVVTNQLVLDKKLMQNEIGLLKQQVCMLQDQKARVESEKERLTKKCKALSAVVKKAKAGDCGGISALMQLVIVVAIGIMLAYLGKAMMY